MANVTTNKVEELLKEGKGAAEIGKQFNISRQAVYYHIDKIKKKGKPKPVFPEPKKDYNSLIDWQVYNEGLVKRGEILLDFDIFGDWEGELGLMNRGKKGRPYEYPESFMQFLWQLKGFFKIDYRTLEGVGRKIVKIILMVYPTRTIEPPDYTTLQFRFGSINCLLKVYEPSSSQEIAVDSSGLKTSNRGEYRMNKYRGKKKKYIKLHIAVNTKTRQLVSCSVTAEEVRDGKEMPRIISEAEKHGEIKKGLFDAGYDSKENYLRLKEDGIKAVIRPRKSMGLKRVKEEIKKEQEKARLAKDKEKKRKSEARLLRLATLEEYLEDEEGWKKKNGYGQRWKAEGRYSVFKRIFGEHVSSKKMKNIKNEVILKANLMNLFTYVIAGVMRRSLVWCNTA